MIDYALWKVIENGETLPKTKVVEGVIIVMPITTAEEKAQRRLEVKARSTLMMGIPNVHQLKFNFVKDAKKLLKAVEKRFEMIDQTFDRLQKLVSQLELLDKKLSQENVNQMLLTSLSLEWNTHAVVWRNKVDLDTMSMDDLYNNLKVYEPEVKEMSNLSSSTQNMAFVSSSNNNTSRTNGAVNTAHGVSTASSQVNDWQQIHPDDIEDMDLIWQMAMLTMKARRECRAPRNQNNKNKESSRRSVPIETSTSTTLVSCNGLGGYDWSDQEEEGPKYALMAFSSLNSGSKIVDNCKKGLGYENYNAVPPPYTGNFIPPTPDLSFTGLDKFVNEPVVVNCKAISSEEDPKKMYCLVVTDDYSRFTWAFLATKDETSGILKSFMTIIEILVDHNVKVIRCDNGTEFKNREMNQFCEMNDHIGKFDGKADEGFFVGYSLNSKTFRVFKSRTRIVEENLHIRFSKRLPNVVGSGPDWLFDIYALIRTMNYEPIVTDPKSSHDDGSKPSSDDGKNVDEDLRKESKCSDHEKKDNVNNTNNVNIVSSTINDVGTNEVNAIDGKISIELSFDLNMPALEDEEPKKVIHALKDPSWIENKRGIVIRNKARLVAQGYTQEEMIDYDKTFTSFARIEAIRLFLVYASFKDFVVYQMDVKSVFLYGKIKEEVYVCQPPGFKDLDFPDSVYMVEKSLYGLHQAPRACHKGNILLVQVYVDAIILGSTKKEICIAFEKLMHEKFQMSSMGELTFFLGLQVKHKKDGIFISQDKYVAEILVKTASTPMETQKPMFKDEDGEEVDVYMYRIFRYLKGQPKLGLWYPKDSSFNLVAYTDSDYARASMDRKSITEGYQFLGCRLISWQCKKQTMAANSTIEAKYVVALS
nr:hypothetical protein [Tanacetum cinerariifolium]